MIEELYELLSNNKSFISIIEMPLATYNLVIDIIRNAVNDPSLKGGASREALSE